MSLAAGSRVRSTGAFRQTLRVADTINLKENYYGSHALLASVSVFIIVHLFESASIVSCHDLPACGQTHAGKYLCVSKD